MAAPPLLTDLLKAVSRSFYLTLRVLPAAVRPQIGLAYLLARATDTIADTDAVPLEDRLAALERLRARILGLSSAPFDGARFIQARRAEHPGASTASTPELVLLARLDEAITQLEHFSPADQQLVRDVLETITSGQILDLRRFAGAKERVPDGWPRVVALQTGADLDDYTFRVAGCVGAFWTRMCRAHLFPEAPLDDAFLLTSGVRFGQGLQLVNILRDLPRDLRAGRCYLPADELAAVGLAPADLLDPGVELRLRPVYNAWLRKAEDHLAAGWAYTNALPRRCVRVRLACAWPALLGARTLARLRTGPVLDPEQRIKVSRPEVRRLLLVSCLRYPAPGAWARQFEKALRG